MTFKRFISKAFQTSLYTAFFAGFATMASASVSMTIAAEKLKDSSGVDIPVTGVVCLVVDANGDGFSGPATDAFVQDDDVLVEKWTIADANNTAGALFVNATVSYTGDMTEGDSVALMWFPSLTSASTEPGEAVAYGMYTATVGAELDNSNPWVLPADGTIGYNLYFLTTDATVLTSGVAGSSDAVEGNADEATAGTLPVGPTGVTAATNGPGSMVISWTDAADDETGYRIDRQADGGSWETIYTTAAGVETYNDDTVGFEVSYVYRVITVRDASLSEVTDESTSDAVVSEGSPARINAIASRSVVGSDAADGMFGTFVVKGGPKDIYIRSSIPTASAVYDDRLVDGTITLQKLTNIDGVWTWVTVDTSDDWVDHSTYADMMSYNKNLPANDEDPAMLIRDLPAGTYSANVLGKDGNTGIATVEIYELDDGGEGTISAIASRANVGSEAADGMFGTFVVKDGVRDIYIRSSIPAASAVYDDRLLDGTITLQKLTNIDGVWTWVTVDTTDDWVDHSTYADMMTYNKNLPENDEDPAMLIKDLPAGTYSANVLGKDGNSGIATVEIYDVTGQVD